MSTEEYESRLKDTKRNDPCPCGSGKKYKKCHLDEDQEKSSATLKAIEEKQRIEAEEKAKEDEGSSEESSQSEKKKVSAKPVGKPSSHIGKGSSSKGGMQVNLPRKTGG